MSASRNGYIGRAPGDSSVLIARKTYEPTGVQTDFTFAAGYTPGYCDVYLNGVKLIDATDYSATNGSTVGLTSAAASGDVVEVVAYKAFNLGVPLSNITGNLDITGNISASSSITVDSGFYGDGSNLSGVAGAAITQYISANSLAVLGSPGVSTITRLGATDLNVTGIITANGLSGNVTGAACTFTTGTFNGNVTIGGTLTYEDVTNVDSLGIVTARAGVNISGGELLVGSNIKGGTAGVLTATSFSGSGANLTSLPAGTTITVADESSDTTCFPSFFTAATGDLAPKTGTNLTFNSSTGALTATSFVGDGSNLTGISGAVAGTTGDFSSNLTVGSGITFGSAGVATFSGTGDVHLLDNVKLEIGDASDLTLFHDGSASYIRQDGTGYLYIDGNDSDTATQIILRPDRTETALVAKPNAEVELYYNNSQKWETTNDGTVTTGICTATGGLAINADSKNLTIGAGEDLKLYHNGSHSYADNATGSLFVRSDNQMYFQATNGDRYADFVDGGAVKLYYSNAAENKKFETTNDGTVTTGIATATGGLEINADSKYLKIGAGGDLQLFHNGTNSLVKNTTGDLVLESDSLKLRSATGGESYIQCTLNGSVDLRYNDSLKLVTTNDGVSITGIATVTQGLNTDGLLSEKFHTTAGKLSDNTNIDLENGMVHYFSTQETTTSTPNIRYNSSKSLNNMLSTGDSITVTIITTAATAGYSANMNIDGNGQTEEWVGGSAPSAGGAANGHDIYSYTILKTSSSPAYKVIANVVNATN